MKTNRIGIQIDNIDDSYYKKGHSIYQSIKNYYKTYQRQLFNNGFFLYGFRLKYTKK